MASSEPRTMRLITATPNIILTPRNVLISSRETLEPATPVRRPQSPHRVHRLPDSAGPESAPVVHPVVARPSEQPEINEQQPDGNDPFARLDVAAGVFVQFVRLRHVGFWI